MVRSFMLLFLAVDIAAGAVCSRDEGSCGIGQSKGTFLLQAGTSTARAQAPATAAEWHEQQAVEEDTLLVPPPLPPPVAGMDKHDDGDHVHEHQAEGGTPLVLPPLPPPVNGLGLLQLATPPSDRETKNFELVKALRAEGYTCPDGTYFSPSSAELVWDCRLSRAAEQWSKRMADEGFFSHQRGDSDPCKRTETEGYPRYQGCGENIAAGKESAEDTFEQWKKSNGHCKNMMDPSYTHFAVGHAYNVGSQYRHYWTQAFGSAAIVDQSCLGGTVPSPQPSPEPSPQPSTQPSPSDCVDTELYHCGAYKNAGYCDWVESVRSTCQKTCRLCGAGSAPPPKPPVPSPQPSPQPTPLPSRCVDTELYHCGPYKSAGYCDWVESVRSTCQRTCGLCA